MKQEAAIIDYFLGNDSYYKLYGAVTIPAFCIFQSEVLDDGRIKVYGNFWIFVYMKQDTTLVCESGGECPGVIYLKQDGDGYAVDEFDRVGDGTDYEKDIDRICDGNDSLREMYYSATNAKEDPLKSRRLWYIYHYVQDNKLDITQYQDFGWDPVSITEVENWAQYE